MIRIGKVFSLFFLIIMAISSVMMTNCAIAQAPTLTHTPSPWDPTPTPIILADYAVSASAGPGGTISPNGTGMFAYPGSSWIFTITPNPGYKILDVKDNDVSIGAISTYKFTIVQESHIIKASFSLVSNPTITPTPKVPEFTIVPTGPSFDIPPTYYFNSNTGQFDSNDGYHIQFSTVKIIIKNQPFTNQSFNDNFYYNVRIKPHNYQDSYWQELYSAGADGYPIQTISNYTIIPISVEGTQALGVIIPTGETTDIQVEAMIGHIGRNNTMVPYYPYVFFGETSGWSNIQTVTLPPKIAFTTSPNPTPTPTVPELSLLGVIPLMVGMFAIAVILGHRKPIN
jgi:hypothetical protein